MEWFQQIFNVIGAVVVFGGGSVGIAFGLFRFFGEKWLSARFDRELEHLRHQQSKELEQLRFKISQMMDRTTKLHEREFEVVPEAWVKLVDAFHSTNAHISSMKSRPAASRMNGGQLEEFLTSSELTETQKTELRESDDRDRTYGRLIYWHEKHRAEQAARELSTYLAKYGIFISNKAAFADIADMIWAALLEYQLNEEDGIIPKEREDKKKLEGAGKAALDALEAEIHDRLWKTDLSGASLPAKV